MKTIQLLISVSLIAVTAGVDPHSSVGEKELIDGWETSFDIFDVNNDKLLNWNDAEYIRSLYESFTGECEDQANCPADKLDRWWTDCVIPRGAEMTKSQYTVKVMEFMTDVGKVDFDDIMNDCYDILFDIYDTDSDRFISWEEYTVGCTVFGLEMLANDYDAFLAFDPHGKGIPKSRFTEALSGVRTASHNVWTEAWKHKMILDGLE